MADKQSRQKRLDAWAQGWIDGTQGLQREADSADTDYAEGLAAAEHARRDRLGDAHPLRLNAYGQGWIVGVATRLVDVDRRQRDVDYARGLTDGEALWEASYRAARQRYGV